MNVERFEELLGRLLDEELTPAEGDELAAVLRAEPERRRALRQHLVLWELWAQQQAPERSADAFLAACRTRLRAERQGDSFLTRLKERISRDTTHPKRQKPVITRWSALLRPTGLAWAASASFLLLGALLWLVAAHRTAVLTVVQGEAVCPACVLHIGHEHVPAVRVQKDGVATVYYLKSSSDLSSSQSYFCGGPTPVKVEGKAHRDGDRLILDVSHIELPSPAK